MYFVSFVNFCSKCSNSDFEQKQTKATKKYGEAFVPATWSQSRRVGGISPLIYRLDGNAPKADAVKELGSAISRSRSRETSEA